jgi:cytochrome P450
LPLSKTIGVDSTATTITYIIYSLEKHPQYVKKIADELSSYPDVDSLTSLELEKLPYLNAVIRESLRMYPPFGSPAGRVCPPEGRMVNGCYIPGGVVEITRCI